MTDVRELCADNLHREFLMMPIATTRRERIEKLKTDQRSRQRLYAALNVLLIFAACAFFSFHYLHLDADFPNYSRWTDWSKYTDEGWYGDAAIRHYQRGSWYVAGDFNPAAALPVWPVLEAAVFHFTGVSLEAARALTVSVFGLTLFAAYVLLRRWNRVTNSGRGLSVSSGLGTVMLAASPFCYVFTRLAILEPLLVLLMLLSLILVSYAPVNGFRRGTDRAGGPQTSKLLILSFVSALGLMLPLMVLTKTTAVFLFPAIGWLLYARCGRSIRSFIILALPSCLIALFSWGLYFSLLVRAHYLSDYQYLFSANAYTRISFSNAIGVLSNTIEDGMWMGRILYPLSIFCAFAALLGFQRLHRNPLIPALLLWAAGYLCFLAYHDNLQPRYYLVIAVPLTLMSAIVVDGLWISPLGKMTAARPFRLIWSLVPIALTILAVSRDAGEMLHYVRTPEYTFSTAARKIREAVLGYPGHSPLVLSISGSELSLITGLPSICDDFGTMELDDRVRTYRPGWYAAWNQVDDDKMDALAPLYHLERVAAFPAMDDPGRNQLILYRLDPPTATTRSAKGRRNIPLQLRTREGQQPSVEQLEH